MHVYTHALWIKGSRLFCDNSLIPWKFYAQGKYYKAYLDCDRALLFLSESHIYLNRLMQTYIAVALFNVIEAQMKMCTSRQKFKITLRRQIS